MNYSSTQNHSNLRRQQPPSSLKSQTTLDSQSSQSQSQSNSQSESDDDIPLGQRHPDALKAQAILRSKSYHKRNSNKNIPIKNLSSETNQHRLDTLSKLSAQSNKDEDDNKPLSFIKRLKSLSKQPPHKPPLSPNFYSNSNYPISVDQLTQKLQIVQHLGLKPSVLQSNPSKPNQNTHLARIDTRPQIRSNDPEPLSLETNHISPSIQSSQPVFLKSPIEQTSPTSYFYNPLDPTNHHHHHHHQPPSHHIERETSNQSNSNPSSTIPKRAKTLAQTNRSPPELKQPSTRLQKSSPERHHHQSSASQALARTKSLSDKLVSNNPSQSQHSVIPLPPVSFSNTHNPSSYPQQSNNQQHDSKLPTLKSSALHLNTNENAQLESHHLSSQINSPIEALSSIPKKKLLIKLAIVNPSQSIMVEIDQDTLPKDLLREAEQSGQLIDEHTKGTWGVFEVWRDLEIERPVREIEKISKVVETWTSVDTNETYLLIQRNEISGLSVSKRSFTSGSYGGNLWCELKPGKWSKKFVLLRDNAIYLCSNDKGKDEMFLCTMEKFDVYAIPPWAHKNLKGVPREHSFGVKSLNKFSFFETKSDFVHKFSCKDRLIQLDWIRRLYDARTYIVMSQLNEEEATRPSPADLSRARSQTEKTKSSMGLKRGKTLLGNQANARKETIAAVPKPENGPRTEPINLNAAGNLARKPTLVKASALNKFKQGTLLGKLEQSANLNGPNQVEETPNTNLSAILPPHVMPLSIHPSSEIGSDHLNQVEETSHKYNNIRKQFISHKTATSSAMTKARTWEQMGPEERKSYLNQVEHQAKAEGRTLLHFEQDNSSNNGNGGFLAGLNPSTNPPPNSNRSGSGLNRSRTLGSHHGRSKPPKVAL